MENIRHIVESKVKAKAVELSSWKPARWEGGRLYYEAKQIKKEIAEYDVTTQILYLESLIIENYILLDCLPNCVPDVTKDFKKWLQLLIRTLKKNTK